MKPAAWFAVGLIVAAAAWPALLSADGSSPPPLRDYPFKVVASEASVRLPVTVPADVFSPEPLGGGLCLVDPPRNTAGVMGVAWLTDLGARLADGTRIGTVDVHTDDLSVDWAAARLRCVGIHEYLAYLKLAPPVDTPDADRVIKLLMGREYVADSRPVATVIEDTTDEATHRRSIRMTLFADRGLPPALTFVAECEVFHAIAMWTAADTQQISVDASVFPPGTRAVPRCGVVERSVLLRQASAPATAGGPRTDGPAPVPAGEFGAGAFRPGGGCANPLLKHRVEPAYTHDGMLAKIEGDVEIEAVVLKDGTVGALRFVRHLDVDRGLDASALAAARQWTFTPAMCHGEPVDMVVTIQFQFRLHKKQGETPLS